MTQYSKLNIVYRMQKWMDSVPGQTFMNYAYSWGASVVILGTLFKLTHLPGANVMLFLGMGTEVFVFFISAFDRPFDKTTIDMDLTTHYDEEGNNSDATGEEHTIGGAQIAEGVVGGGVIGGGVIGGGIVGGGVVVGGSAEGEGGQSVGSNGASGTIIIGGGAMNNLAEQQSEAEELSEAQTSYVEQLKSLTETLQSVAEQSKRLALGSEEMENLNRTITGIAKVYEMQLKTVSMQVGTIDDINEQTRQMAEKIQELNKIYARMIEGLTNKA